MSSSRYVGRHGTAGRRRLPLPSVGASRYSRTAVKAVAGVGIVLGSGAFIITPSSAIGTVDLDPSVLGAEQSLSAADLLADRSTEESDDSTASRSAQRDAPAAITAPAGATGQSETGELGVEPVAKPEPEPVEEPTSRASTSSQAGATPAPSSGVQTGGYASQAAAIGLGPSASAVYSAVRNQFPDLSNIGGYRAGDPGDHGAGRAVDIMVTGARGDQLAAWLQQNAGSLNIKYLIWEQRIWRPGSSWSFMEDRGSATANHYDHVHVSVN